MIPICPVVSFTYGECKSNFGIIIQLSKHLECQIVSLVRTGMVKLADIPRGARPTLMLTVSLASS